MLCLHSRDEESLDYLHVTMWKIDNMEISASCTPVMFVLLFFSCSTRKGWTVAVIWFEEGEAALVVGR